MTGTPSAGTLSWTISADGILAVETRFWAGSRGNASVALWQRHRSAILSQVAEALRTGAQPSSLTIQIWKSHISAAIRALTSIFKLKTEQGISFPFEHTAIQFAQHEDPQVDARGEEPDAAATALGDSSTTESTDSPIALVRNHPAQPGSGPIVFVERPATSEANGVATITVDLRHRDQWPEARTLALAVRAAIDEQIRVGLLHAAKSGVTIRLVAFLAFQRDETRLVEALASLQAVHRQYGIMWPFEIGGASFVEDPSLDAPSPAAVPASGTVAVGVPAGPQSGADQQHCEPPPNGPAQHGFGVVPAVVGT